MSDPQMGIVQSPQYFETNKKIYTKAPLAYGAAYQEEIFYRIIQVARSRIGGAICCGSNAIYRREALKSIGGPKQVDASEDSRTGFAMVDKGWKIKYVPLILTLGVCPDNIYAYFHQQHRWCKGRSELVLSQEFRKSKVKLLIKLCNISGFMGFIARPLTILISFQLFWIVYFYNEHISFANALIFYPYIIFAMVILPISHIARPRRIVFYNSIIQLYASTHALLSAFFKRSVKWVATGAKHTTVSPAFKHTMYGVGLYVGIYGFLTFIALVTGYIHLFNLNYYSVQFWLFYNLFFSGLLFFQMHKFYQSTKL